MTAFQESLAELEQRNALVLAVSVDSKEDSQALIDMLGLTFPVGYGLDYLEFAEKTGAFYEVRRGIIHATTFIVRKDGTIANSVFASGPIGRFWPEDCVRVIDFYNR